MRLILAAALAAGCSPAYVMKSAAGHAGLLWRRRSLDAMAADPRTPPALREKLKVAREARAFAFDEMGLKRSRDYSTVSEVRGAYVTYIVSACAKTRFERYQWWFPVIGRVPYKGYYRKEDAEAEAGALERRGWDVAVSGVPAYHTPLWFSDPIPSPVLDYPSGDLAALLIHELTHGTVFFKDAVDFDESLAEFVGNKGAEDYLARRFGADSKELQDFRSGLAGERRFAEAMNEAYERLDALYRSSEGDAVKLREREKSFRSLADRLQTLYGKPYAGRVNNAMVMAHRLYHEQSGDFSAVYERCGRDWKKTLEVFKSLDRKDPRKALRAWVYSNSFLPR